ncbi:hypothetical protein ANTPLA_LOCUS7431 [Anthophora plagiata]
MAASDSTPFIPPCTRPATPIHAGPPATPTTTPHPPPVTPPQKQPPPPYTLTRPTPPPSAPLYRLRHIVTGITSIRKRRIQASRRTWN